jgi:hypothetical protein
MNISKTLAFGLSIGSFALLTACGGGGGGGTASGTEANSTTTPGAFGPAGSAEGTWIGPYASVYNTRMVVLNTSEAFGIYETGGSVAGALYGQLSSNGIIKGVLKDFSLNTLRAEDASVSGSSTAQKSMLLNRGTQRLDLSYAPNMNSPVSVAAVAGVYSGRGRSTFAPAEAMNLTISDNGAVTLPEPVCSATGQISPHPNGQNVFALSLTITGNNCGRKGNTLNGVLYQDPDTKRLFVLGLNQTKSDAAFFFGYRN